MKSAVFSRSSKYILLSTAELRYDSN